MKASHVAALLAISCLGGITAFPDHGRADDILIEATGQTTWKAGGSQSDGPDNPLIVLAKKDDVLEIKALAGPHGFATLNKKGNESPAVEPKFVVACGETPDTKPDAVFLETECSRIRQTTFREHEAESVGQVPERYPFLVCHPSVGYVGHDLTEAVAQSVYRAMRSTRTIIGITIRAWLATTFYRCGGDQVQSRSRGR